MSTATARAKKPIRKKKSRRLRTMVGGTMGLMAGLMAAYVFAYVERVSQPEAPVANFTISADGTTIQCQNLALGYTGWWDFGDGTPLVPFDPSASTVLHQYEKPGTYTVRLRVLNKHNQEHERLLAVTVRADTSANTHPTITNLKVEPVGSPVAPALFRVTFHAANADKVMIFNGVDTPPDVLLGAQGNIERYVVYENPLQAAVQVFAVAGHEANMAWARASVEPARRGAFSLVARVQDVGQQLHFKPLKLMVPIRWQPGQTTVVERVIHPELGYRFSKQDKTQPTTQAGAEVDVAVALDQLNAKLTVCWPHDARGLLPANPIEMLVPVELQQEREIPLPERVQRSAGHLVMEAGFFGADLLNAKLLADVPLPPVPENTPALQRMIRLELLEMNAKPTLIHVLADATVPQQQWVTTTSGQRRVLQCQPSRDGQFIRVTLLPN